MENEIIAYLCMGLMSHLLLYASWFMDEKEVFTIDDADKMVIFLLSYIFPFFNVIIFVCLAISKITIPVYDGTFFYILTRKITIRGKNEK